jgi:hypothetical protein
LSAVGRNDLDGDDWGDIFAAAVNGIHLNSPLGVIDVTLGTTGWSAKTVKAGVPASSSRVRLISGRNSPIFSHGTQDFFADIQETGNQVLQIWNARVEEATQQHPHLRTIILLRNIETFQFKVFEQPTMQFDPADYEWRLNARNNFEGRTKHDNTHSFTWQPHGSQFTILRQVSGSARSFQIQKPGVLDPEQVLNNLGYSDEWVKFL